ncbi:MAG: hypothetical protein WBE14_11250 [Xanthobacteraceae bacterium]
MKKLLALFAASAMAATLVSSSAFAWDNCGHGFHRNFSGFCVSELRSGFRLSVRLSPRLERARLRTELIDITS